MSVREIDNENFLSFLDTFNINIEKFKTLLQTTSSVVAGGSLLS